MDLNEQLKGWLMQQAQPGSFLDKAGLGLAQAGQTIGQDAAAGAAILNDPRNSWIGMNPVGKAVGGGLGLVGMVRPFFHGTSMKAGERIMQEGFLPTGHNADAGASQVFFGTPGAGRPATTLPFLYAIKHSDEDGSALVKSLIDDSSLVDMRHDIKGWGGDLPSDFLAQRAKWAADGKVGVMTPNETIVWDAKAINPVKLIELYKKK